MNKNIKIIKNICLVLFFLINSFNYVYSSEILNEDINSFIETDNDLLNFFRKSANNPNISDEEINLYKKKSIFFENFFEKKMDLNDEEIKNKIILIKENLLNEKAADFEYSINKIFKNNVSSKKTLNYLIDQSNYNIDNKVLIEKQTIIENLKNSNKIEEIQNLIKEYKGLDLKTEKEIKLIFDKNKKGKKNLFKFLGFANNCNFSLLALNTSFAEKWFEASLRILLLIDYYVHKKDNTVAMLYVLAFDFFLKLNNKKNYMIGISSIYGYTFFQNYKLINNFKKNILFNFNKKIEIVEKIKNLIEKANENKKPKLKEFDEVFLNKKINNEKNKINELFKNDFYKKPFKLLRNENYVDESLMENYKKNSTILNYDFKENKFIKNNNSIYFLNNFINFSDSLCALALIKKNNLSFSYPKIIEKSKTPILKITEMISPETENCVKNNVDLNNNNDKNMLITGPTGAGKTNYLEQTIKCLKYANLGITPAQNMEYTPFKYIFNNLFLKKIHKASKNQNENGNIYDFEKYFDSDNFKLLLMDEIYSSTTPEQAYIETIHELTKHIKDNKSIFIATSHYKEHVQLCKDFENKMKEYFVSVENKENDEKEFILKFKIIDNTNKDENWWFKEDEASKKKRYAYAIWKKKLEKEKLMNAKNS